MHPHREEMYLKYRAAQELGLMDKLLRVGWAGLSAKETGRVGGMVRQMKKAGKEP
ncbi:MAG: small acid-soluble spore protein alpha/beta type [Clostridia bacterium]|nr:small acid-soluble spore protein alpha/beta type [Clostridia bacterium]